MRGKFNSEDLENSYKEKKYDYLKEYDPLYFWEDLGKYYLDTFQDKDYRQQNLVFLLSRLKAIKPKSILEVGCGFGRCMATILANKVCDNVVGVEFSSSQIEGSREFLRRVTDYKGGLNIIQADACDLPFEDKTFELSFTHVCFTHIPFNRIEKARREISRVTKNWIILIERYNWDYAHPRPHIYSHQHVPCFMEMGWEIHEYSELNPKYHTKILVLRGRECS